MATAKKPGTPQTVHDMAEAAKKLSAQPPKAKTIRATPPTSPPAPASQDVPAASTARRRGYATAPECVSLLATTDVEVTVVGGTVKPRGGWRLKLTGSLTDEQVDQYLQSSTIFVYLPDGENVPNQAWMERAIALGVPVVAAEGLLPCPECGVEVGLDDFDARIASARQALALRVKEALRRIERDYDSYVAACLNRA